MGSCNAGILAGCIVGILPTLLHLGGGETPPGQPPGRRRYPSQSHSLRCSRTHSSAATPTQM